MFSKLVENKLIPFFAFTLGVSICVSTSGMSISYVALAVLILFRSDFIPLFKQTLQSKYVQGSVIFYLVFVLAVCWSSAPIHSSGAMLTRMIGFILAPFLLLAFQTNNSGKVMLNGFILGALLTVSLSTLSYIFNHHILYGIHDGTWVVFHGHILHNAFMSIAASFLLLKVLDKESSRKIRISCLLAYILCLINVIFIVYGRTGQVMFVSMSAFVLLYQFRVKGLLLLAVVSVIALPLLYFSPMVQQGIHNYKSDMSKYESGDAQTSMGARLVFHKVSIALIKAKPLIGYGTGSFANEYSKYIAARGIKEVTVNPHRDIYWIAVETGALGVLAFALMLVLCVINLFQLPHFYRGVGLSLLLGYLLASIQNSFFIDNVTGMTFGFIMLSLIATGSNFRKITLLK